MSSTFGKSDQPKNEQDEATQARDRHIGQDGELARMLQARENLRPSLPRRDEDDMEPERMNGGPQEQSSRSRTVTGVVIEPSPLQSNRILFPQIGQFLYDDAISRRRVDNSDTENRENGSSSREVLDSPDASNAYLNTNSASARDVDMDQLQAGGGHQSERELAEHEDQYLQALEMDSSTQIELDRRNTRGLCRGGGSDRSGRPDLIGPSDQGEWFYNNRGPIQGGGSYRDRRSHPGRPYGRDRHSGHESSEDSTDLGEETIALGNRSYYFLDSGERSTSRRMRRNGYGSRRELVRTVDSSELGARQSNFEGLLSAPGRREGTENRNATKEEILDIKSRNYSKDRLQEEKSLAEGHQLTGNDAATSEDNQKPEKCAICLSEFEEGENVKDLPCGHTFHSECVDRWLQINRTCPLCKRSIRPSERQGW